MGNSGAASTDTQNPNGQTGNGQSNNPTQPDQASTKP
jgi:hypothetical protein